VFLGEVTNCLVSSKLHNIYSHWFAMITRNYTTTWKYVNRKTGIYFKKSSTLPGHPHPDLSLLKSAPSDPLGTARTACFASRLSPWADVGALTTQAVQTRFFAIHLVHFVHRIYILPQPLQPSCLDRCRPIFRIIRNEVPSATTNKPPNTYKVFV
jgi:hypothetical protein